MRDDCYARSARLAREIGAGAQLVSGWFRPETDPSAWTREWSELLRAHPRAAQSGFAHAWVRTSEAILDPTADAFGEPSGVLVRRLDDPRYREAGVIDPTAL